jgi:hypothetical protein
MRDIRAKDYLPAHEDGPRNDTGPTTVAMFLEEFHEWGERHDHNHLVYLY